MLPVEFKNWAMRPLIQKPIRFSFPWKGKQVTVSIVISNQLVMILILLLLVVASFQLWIMSGNQEGKLFSSRDAIKYQDVVGYAFKHLDESQEPSVSLVKDHRATFLEKKHTLISQTLIKNRVSRLDQLSNNELLKLNDQISTAFRETVLQNIKVEPHVMKFFTDTTDLKKFETALMEQAKFHVPASIKLAQAALETAYGQRVIHNNYFGIKDKSNKTQATTTTEYYTKREYQANKSKVIRKEKIKKDGKTLYKCIIKDSFAAYSTPWHSFRAHSVFLNQSKRYSPLFTKGKDYEDWADKIGSTKYGGVGYATSPIYGQLLKKIIKRYNLDLLDY